MTRAACLNGAGVGVFGGVIGAIVAGRALPPGEHIIHFSGSLRGLEVNE